jgi:hypothetical protein
MVINPSCTQIITPNMVYWISHSNPWSTSLALTKLSWKKNQCSKSHLWIYFWKQINRSLARGLHKLYHIELTLKLQILWFAISYCMLFLLVIEHLSWSRLCCCLHGDLSRKHLFGIGIKMRIDRRDLKKIPTQTQQIKEFILQTTSNRHSSPQASIVQTLTI